MFYKIGNVYRNAFTGLSTSNWLLGIILLINRSGTMVVPFMAVYLTKVLHYDITYAGYAMMCYGAGSVAGAYLGGRFSDKIGFYPVMFWSLVLNGLLFFVLAYMQVFLLFCLIVFVLSLAGESFRPANATAIAHYSTPENRTRSYSVHRLAVNLGWGIGLALGGWVASMNYKLIFWVDGLTCLAAAIFMIGFLPKPQKSLANAEVEKPKSTAHHSAYRDRIYLFFIGIVTLFALCFFQLSSTLPLFYKDVMRLDEQAIGLVLAINGMMIALVEMVLIYLLEGKGSGLTHIARGVMLTGFSFLMLNIFPPALWVAIAGMIINTLGEIFSLPFMTSFWISRSQPHNRGEYAGLYTMAWSVAQIFAPIIGTQVVGHFGFAALWYVMTALCIFILFVLQVLKRRIEQ